jgi:hypothetical protein
MRILTDIYIVLDLMCVVQAASYFRLTTNATPAVYALLRVPSGAMGGAA